MSEQVYWRIRASERTIGMNLMARVRYLLQQPPDKTLTDKTLNNIYSSMFKAYEAEESRPHPMAYLVWAINRVGYYSVAKNLAQLGGSPDGWNECDPLDPVLLMRRRIVEMDRELSEKEDFRTLVEHVLASDMDNENPDNFPPTAEGRMSFYSELHKREIIAPDNLQPLRSALIRDRKDLLADRLVPITISDFGGEPLFHGMRRYVLAVCYVFAVRYCMHTIRACIYYRPHVCTVVMVKLSSLVYNTRQSIQGLHSLGLPNIHSSPLTDTCMKFIPTCNEFC